MTSAVATDIFEEAYEVSTSEPEAVRPKRTHVPASRSGYIRTGVPLSFLVQVAGVAHADTTNWLPITTPRERPAEIAYSAGTYRLAALKNELRLYTNLPANWDGQGGIAPSRKAANEALAFLDLLPPDILLPKPMVEGDGELSLYWRREGKYLELGFLGDGHVDYYGEDEASGDEIMSKDELDGSHVRPQLIEFIRRF